MKRLYVPVHGETLILASRFSFRLAACLAAPIIDVMLLNPDLGMEKHREALDAFKRTYVWDFHGDKNNHIDRTMQSINNQRMIDMFLPVETIMTFQGLSDDKLRVGFRIETIPGIRKKLKKLYLYLPNEETQRMLIK